MNPFEEIKQLLDEIDYDLIEHEHVVTSDEAARVRGLDISEGMKSLVLKADEQTVLVVVRADNKLHSNKVRKHFGARNLRFADPDHVHETMGVKIGACYPFGVVPDIPMIVDATLDDNEYVSFNPGIHTKTIRMKWSDYKKKMKPQLIDIVKPQT
jgi:prolyl-tRNA editing enzyme YbaK/EbsC (Cys-tRNA(Pro) deacylase)